jgi:hypothetical protein
MLQNIADFKAKSFLTERNTSTMAYEVKAVRALWDPSLSIPGTNRRGGWRCPTGTRYGGQITDRFGRSCGWGVARRIANQISDIGQRLENVDDARRGRRIARRERRILARLNPDGAGAGRIEQGLRGVAERLDGGDAPNPRGARRRTVVARPPSVDAPDTPRVLAPARNDRNLLAAEPLNVLEEMRDELENATGGRDSDDYKRVMAELKRRNAVARPARRRRAPNLRESEQRRMEREIDQPGAPRTGEAPARPARERGNLLAAEPLNILEEMRDELENTTDGRDSDDYKRVIAELKRRNAPARPARRRRAVQPRGEGNLRESEQRRMDREIEQPGAPRTGEAPARRRRRAVVEATKKPKAPKQQEENAVEKPIVEPKIVKPRRPRKNPEGDIGAMLDAESEQRRVPRPVPRGQSDNAARSEEVRANRARKAARKVDLNQALNDDNFQDYVVRDVIPNDRIMIVNDPANFPQTPVKKRDKRDEASAKITASNARLERLQQAIERGEISDNDFIERNGEKINIARVKTYIKDFRDSWQEILDANKDDVIAPAPKIDPIDAPFNAPTRRDIRDVPDELKHVAPKMGAAKFKKEDEDLIEEVLLQMRDPKLLGQLGLAADQALFNQNEGRQLAVRNFQKELSRVADLLRANPNADVSALVSEAKRKYIGYVRPQGGVAGARTRLAELETQLSAEFRLMRSPLGNTPEVKEFNRVETMKKIAQLQSDIGKYEGHIQLIEALGPEIRKASERRKQGFVFNPDATNIPKPLPEDVAKKINDQVNEAIERRQGKLAKYLKQRHPNGGAPYEDMTPAKWGRLTAPEKAEYLKQAYSHQRIEGKNGKLYRATATVSPQNGFQVQVQFDEINANGEVIRAKIATSSRSVSVSQGIVSQNSMFVTSKIDRGADIQTIYNQHAFLYLKQIGVTKANVNAADDGQYVWARVGFKRNYGLNNSDLQVLQSPLKFYEDFGAGGLINNDAEYARIKSILAQARGGKQYQHQDIIFALDDPTGDREKMEYVKQWFKANLGFGGGTLSFAEQKIGQKVPKKAKTPRPRIRVEPPRLA